MSQAAALQQAVAELNTAVAALAAKIANVTPDADVAAAVTALQAVVTQLQQLAQ